MSKKRIDIEKLVQWAFRDELPKQGANPFSPWEPILRYGSNGGHRIDDDAPRGRLPAILGEPHPDARLIERAVNQLEPVEADKRGRGTHRPATVLVMIHAVSGSRPDWYPGSIKVLPIREGSRIRIVGKALGTNRNRTVRYEEGTYCPLRFEPTIEDVDHGRRNYLLWYNSLVHLVNTLELRDHIVLMPNLSPTPWIFPLTRRTKSLTSSKPSENPNTEPWPRAGAFAS